jgi:hypothetical protein
MEDVSLTPEEQLAIERQIRREEIISHAEKVWDAVEALHGWTKRVKREWSTTNMGLVRRIGPWEVYTRFSRETWLMESYPSD